MVWVSTLTAGLREKTESLIYDHYGDSVSVLFKKIPIPEEIKFTAEKNAQLRFMRDQIYIWEISKDEKMIGLAYLDNVKGKSQPITYAVFFDSQGMVEESHIIKYREPIGGEVSNQYWLNQFFGKSWESDYKIGSDIDGISGATISVNAVTRGIHRSTIIVELPEKVRYFFAAFLLVLTIGVSIGLVYVNRTTAMTADGTTEHYAGSTFGDELDIPDKYPKEIEGMLLTTHTHLISFSFIFFFLGALFYMNSIVTSGWKTFFMIEPFISVLGTFGSIWGIRYYSPSFSIATIVFGILTYLTFYLMVAVCIYDLLLKKD